MASKLAKEESKGSQAEYKKTVAESNARAGLSKNPKFAKDIASVGNAYGHEGSTYPSGAKVNLEKPVKYNAEAVQKQINKDPRIKGKEAKAIHALLKGRTGDLKPVGDTSNKALAPIAKVVPRSKRPKVDDVKPVGDAEYGPYTAKVYKAKADLERAQSRMNAVKASGRVARNNTNASEADAQLERARKAYKDIMMIASGAHSEDASPFDVAPVGDAESYRGFKLKEEGIQASGYKPVWTARKNGKIKGWNKHLPFLKANIDAGDCGRAADASPFDVDTDAKAAKLIKRESKTMTSVEIARKYGFSLSFVKDVLGETGKGSLNEVLKTRAQDIRPVGDAGESSYRYRQAALPGPDAPKFTMTANGSRAVVIGGLGNNRAQAIKIVRDQARAYGSAITLRLMEGSKEVFSIQGSTGKAKDIQPVGDAALWVAVDEEGSIFYGPADKTAVEKKMTAYKGPYKLHLERR